MENTETRTSALHYEAVRRLFAKAVADDLKEDGQLEYMLRLVLAKVTAKDASFSAMITARGVTTDDVKFSYTHAAEAIDDGVIVLYTRFGEDESGADYGCTIAKVCTDGTLQVIVDVFEYLGSA